jgi:hypothetical protein
MMRISHSGTGAFAALLLVVAVGPVLSGCPSDDDDEAAGSVDTSSTQYCSDYVEVCTSDGLRASKEEACLEECTTGVKVAAWSVRDSVCWKVACSLELGVCETYSSDEANNAYRDQIYDCAMRHGWYEEFPGHDDWRTAE